MTDKVNHPSHYNKYQLEIIDEIEKTSSKEMFIGYLIGNAKKYLGRYDLKGDPIENLDKAIWHINRLKKFIGGKTDKKEYATVAELTETGIDVKQVETIKVTDDFKVPFAKSEIKRLAKITIDQKELIEDKNIQIKELKEQIKKLESKHWWKK